MAHEIVTVEISTILRECTGSVDFGRAPTDEDERVRWWQMMFYSKSSDTGFGALVNSILENGLDPEAPIGWDDSGYINEGHHRLTAAFLLGLDFVYATPYGQSNGVICAHNCACNGEDTEDGGLLGVIAAEF